MVHILQKPGLENCFMANSSGPRVRGSLWIRHTISRKTSGKKREPVWPAGKTAPDYTSFSAPPRSLWLGICQLYILATSFSERFPIMENCLWSHESLLIPEVKTPHLWDKFCLGDMEANDVVQHEIKHGATWSPLEVTFCFSSAVFCFPHSISPENPHHLVLWVANLECVFRESDGKESHYRISSVQFISVAKSCPTLCDPTDCSMPGSPVLHYLPESTQSDGPWVSDAI